MRLIDADALDTRERGNNSQRTMWWHIKQIVDAAPTIEAEPVKHGKPNPHIVQWLGSNGNVILEDQVGWECPFCGEDGVKNYCPNCGAKMDLEVT